MNGFQTLILTFNDLDDVKGHSKYVNKRVDCQAVETL